MVDKYPVELLLDAAQQTISAAGCASLITMDESNQPSSRAVAAFAPDDDFSRVIIGTHPDSRKTIHVLRNPAVVLSYIDMTNRGYLTVLGNAVIDEGTVTKKDYWLDTFGAFFPDGPESQDYQLMIITPEVLELRSFGLKIAAEPTRWSPVILRRGVSNEWTTEG